MKTLFSTLSLVGFLFLVSVCWAQEESSIEMMSESSSSTVSSAPEPEAIIAPEPTATIIPATATPEIPTPTPEPTAVATATMLPEIPKCRAAKKECSKNCSLDGVMKEKCAEACLRGLSVCEIAGTEDRCRSFGRECRHYCERNERDQNLHERDFEQCGDACDAGLDRCKAFVR